jgi:hypothetical protein
MGKNFKIKVPSELVSLRVMDGIFLLQCGRADYHSRSELS